MGRRTRTIFELLAAVAEGDSLTPTETRRLKVHEQRRAHLDAVLHRDGVRYEWWNYIEAGAAPHDLMWDSLKRFETLGDVEELRQLGRFYLSMAWRDWEGVAKEEGLSRVEQRDADHRRKQRQAWGSRGGASRRANAKAFVAVIDTLKSGKKPLTNAAAIRRFLSQSDPGWASATEEERTRKINNAVRRRTRANKRTRENIGH